jgi:hypothetical protein
MREARSLLFVRPEKIPRVEADLLAREHDEYADDEIVNDNIEAKIDGFHGKILQMKL